MRHKTGNLIYRITILMYFFLSISRYFHDFFFGSNAVYLAVALTTCVLMVFCSIRYGSKVRVKKLDIAWILIFFLILVDRDWKYDFTRTAMCLFAVIAYFAIRRDIEDIRYGFMICMAFAILSAVATWISLFNQTLYLRIVSTLYGPQTVERIMSSYRRGRLCGLSTHYSCNTFYILSGAMITVANLFSISVNKIKNRKELIVNLLIFMFLSVSALAIGKRGHVTFFVAAILLIYAVLNINITRRIKQIVFASILLIISVPIVSSKLPQTNYFFIRLLDRSNGLSGREVLYNWAFDMFLKSPLWGNGYGSFMVNQTGATDQPGVHNDYLQFLCEWGLIGFILCCVAFFGILYLSCKKLRNIRNMGYSPFESKVLIWSAEFQIFVTLYSLSGLPHYDFEIFMLYTVACSAVFALGDQYKPGHSFGRGRLYEKGGSCNLVWELQPRKQASELRGYQDF